MTFVIAIDGPAGTGKSTISQRVAKKLNFVYVDTGAFYRSLDYISKLKNIDPSDVKSLSNLVKNIKIIIDKKSLSSKVEYENHILSHELRTEDISSLASLVSQHKEVRQELLLLQRNLALSIKDGAIFEGRDITTAVFPKALVKVFICADVYTRAQRRFNELKSKDEKITLEELIESIKQRDERDKNRSNDPMYAAKDAYVLDTSFLSIEDAEEIVLNLVIEAQKIYKKEQSLW